MPYSRLVWMPRKIFPPPTTSASWPPRDPTSRTSSERAARIPSSIPYACLPIRASPDSFSRMRRYTGFPTEPPVAGGPSRFFGVSTPVRRGAPLLPLDHLSRHSLPGNEQRIRCGDLHRHVLGERPELHVVRPRAQELHEHPDLPPRVAIGDDHPPAPRPEGSAREPAERDLLADLRHFFVQHVGQGDSPVPGEEQRIRNVLRVLPVHRRGDPPHELLEVFGLGDEVGLAIHIDERTGPPRAMR